MIWGCLIGLPSLTIADLAQQTTTAGRSVRRPPPPEEVWDLVRLINGVLCLFVFEAVRRQLVVSVAIPLRRVTILGLLLSAPTLLLHRQFEHIGEGVQEDFLLPSWAWLVIATFASSSFRDCTNSPSITPTTSSIARSPPQAAKSTPRSCGRRISPPSRSSSSARSAGGSSSPPPAFFARRSRLPPQRLRRRMKRPRRAVAPARGAHGPPREGADAVSVRTDFAERNGLPAGLARPVLAVPSPMAQLLCDRPLWRACLGQRFQRRRRATWPGWPKRRAPPGPRSITRRFAGVEALQCELDAALARPGAASKG